MTDRIVLVERIARETHNAVTTKYADPALCVLSTAVFVRACDYFGIEAVPTPVRVAAFNPVATEWVLAGKDIDANEGIDCRDAGGWVVQIDTTSTRERRFPAHLVAIVGDYLVDPNFSQFSRPAKNMTLPDYAAFDLSTHEWPGTPFATHVDDSTVVYEHWPTAPDWRTAPDWSDRKAKPLAGQVIRAVRAAMPDRVA